MSSRPTCHAGCEQISTGHRPDGDTRLTLQETWNELRLHLLHGTGQTDLTRAHGGSLRGEIIKKKTKKTSYHVYTCWWMSSIIQTCLHTFYNSLPRSWIMFLRECWTDLPCNQTSCLGHSHLLSASKRHLQHLGVEHRQAERCWDSISPRVHWRQREGMYLPWT